MRTFIVATALVTMMATPVLAQRAVNDGGPMWPSTMATPAPASPQMQRAWRNGRGSYAAAPESGAIAATGGLYENGDYVGWDPDPNIRFQLLRDPKGAGSQ